MVQQIGIAQVATLMAHFLFTMKKLVNVSKYVQANISLTLIIIHVILVIQVVWLVMIRLTKIVLAVKMDNIWI